MCIELAARLTEGKAHQERCITFVRQRADPPAVHCYDTYHRVSRISTIWTDLSFRGGNPLQDSRKESTCYLVSCFSLPPILFIDIYIYIYIYIYVYIYIYMYIYMYRVSTHIFTQWLPLLEQLYGRCHTEAWLGQSILSWLS
jgi:hypothetical protein